MPAKAPSVSKLARKPATQSDNRPNGRRHFLRLSLAAPALASLAAACAPSNRLSPTPARTAESTATLSATQAAEPAALPAPTQAPVQAPTLAATLAPTLAPALAPTPACGDDDDHPTPAQTEGPYYTPDTPAKTNFVEAGMSGTRMSLSGLVLNTACKPVGKALLDLWHCDAQGVYDNSGYRLRGHFFADENGVFHVETIMPGIYPGRTRHFHIKVQAPNQPVLTTQLYFPNEPQNARDGIFRPECLMQIADNADGSKAGSFQFVLDI